MASATSSAALKAATLKTPVPYLPAEIHNLIFLHLALIPRVHEPSISWRTRLPCPPEVFLISRESRATALRTGRFERLVVQHRYVMEPSRGTSLVRQGGRKIVRNPRVWEAEGEKITKEVLKIWWGEGDILYYGPLALQSRIPLKEGLHLRPPQFFAGSNFRYTCYMLDVSLFGGIEESESYRDNAARKAVRNIAVQKEIWDKLGTERSGVRHYTIQAFGNCFENCKTVETFAGSSGKSTLIVEGDIRWFALKAEAQFVKRKTRSDLTGLDGEDSGWVVMRDGCIGAEEYERREVEILKSTKIGRAKLKDKTKRRDIDMKKWTAKVFHDLVHRR